MGFKRQSIDKIIVSPTHQWLGKLLSACLRLQVQQLDFIRFLAARGHQWTALHDQDGGKVADGTA